MVLLIASVGISILIVGVLAWLYALLTCERAVAASLKASVPVPRGVLRALEFCRGDFKRQLPQILVYPEAMPEARIARSLGSPGKILLSQGLTVSFQDDELVEIMRTAAACLSQRGVSTKSACAAWRMRLNRWTQDPVTPTQALGAWMLFPIVQLLGSYESSLDIFQNALPSAALRKASRFQRIFS